MERSLCQLLIINHYWVDGAEDRPAGTMRVYTAATHDYADWMVELFLIPVIGVLLAYVGYGLFSRKKKPTAGVGYSILGFLLRVAGPLLILFGALFWVFVWSMARPPVGH